MSVTRSLLLLPTMLIACAEPKPAQVEPAQVELAVVTATGAPSESAAPLRPKLAPTHGVPDPKATIGDVTCATDADCVVTTALECCACCTADARATSRAWLTWRDGTECPKQSCAPCGKRPCPAAHEASGFVAVCDRSGSFGRCALAAKQ